MRITIVLLASVILAGCSTTTNGYKKFYKPFVDTKTLKNVNLLSEGEEPQVFGTDDIDRDMLILRSKKYIPIGYSAFNSCYEDTKNAIAQAKEVGATIILVSSKYTNTQTRISTLFLPDNRTTYYSGSINENTSYNSAYSGYSGSSNWPYAKKQEEAIIRLWE